MKQNTEKAESMMNGDFGREGVHRFMVDGTTVSNLKLAIDDPSAV